MSYNKEQTLKDLLALRAQLEQSLKHADEMIAKLSCDVDLRDYDDLKVFVKQNIDALRPGMVFFLSQGYRDEEPLSLRYLGTKTIVTQLPTRLGHRTLVRGCAGFTYITPGKQGCMNVWLDKPPI
jgi:hypothetical protein